MAKFTLAGVKRVVQAVTVSGGHTTPLPDGTMVEGTYAAGMYCTVDWNSSDKLSVNVRNFNNPARDVPAVAEALRAAGYAVEVFQRDHSQMNPFHLVVRGGAK
jgi:hypothetical protein